MELSWIADVVTLISGTMTILGISGLVTWSVFRRGERLPFQETILGAAATGLKCGLCLLMLAPFAMLWGAGFSLVAITVTGLLNTFIDLVRHPWWDPVTPIPYLTAWVVPSLVLLPLYLVSALSLITWSLEPARGLWRILNGRRGAKEGGQT